MKNKQTVNKTRKSNNVIKWTIIITIIVLLSSALVLLIFKDKIFKENVIGEKFKITQITEYKEKVKKSKIERIAILSWSTNFETEEKEDINKIMEFIEGMEGYVDDSEISSLVSNTYGIVLYYKDGTNTVITISPKDFAVDESRYYKNKYAYYTTLQKLVEELKK